MTINKRAAMSLVWDKPATIRGVGWVLRMCYKWETQVLWQPWSEFNDISKGMHNITFNMTLMSHHSARIFKRLISLSLDINIIISRVNSIYPGRGWGWGLGGFVPILMCLSSWAECFLSAVRPQASLILLVCTVAFVFGQCVFFNCF